jgi:hypothetical protein
MTKEIFFAQEFDHTKKYWQNLLTIIWDFIEIWDKYCELPYFEYRQQLKEISLANLKSLNCRLIYDKNQMTLDDGLLLIAIDDDDWLCPTVFNAIRGYESADVIIWNHTILKPNGVKNVISSHKLFTNNYALTKAGIKKMQNATQSKEKHTFADDPFFPHYDIHRRIIKTEFENDEPRFKDLNETFKIVHLNQQLSVTNKSLASASELERINKRDFIAQLIQLSSQNIENFLWASKEIKTLNLLNSQLRCKLKQL